MKVIPGNAQGIGARDNQEDAFGFSDFGDEAFEAHGGVMMVLCDGMGGLAKGAAASTAAVKAVLAGYQRKLPSEPIPDALNRVIHEAHRSVCEVSGDGAAAGTTVVAAVVCQDRLYWGSLGDSRLYLCRGNAPAEQLTVDHNVGTRMRAQTQRGESARQEVATMRDQEALTAYLGAPNPPPPDTGRDGRPLEPGDRIVACSDGLYRGLAPDAIAEISRSVDPMTAAEQMVQAVLRQELPHQDNLTVALLEVSAPRRRFAPPDPAWLAKALLVTAAFAAGVLATCLFFLIVIPRISGPESPQPPAMAVGQPLPIESSAGGPAETPPATNPDAGVGTNHSPNSAPSTVKPRPGSEPAERNKQKPGLSPGGAGANSPFSASPTPIPLPPPPPPTPPPPHPSSGPFGGGP